MNLVSLNNATIGYQNNLVLKDISLEIEEAEFVAICGINGCGKSTLLKSLVGILPLIKGSISYNFDLQLNPLGYVPQSENFDAIFPLTVKELVLQGTLLKRKFFKSLSDEDLKTAAECLSAVGIEDLAGRSYFELSGGQKQRALIARALAVKPKLIFLDEPTSGVDIEAEYLIMKLLQSLQQKEKITVIVVSHNLQIVEEIVPGTILIEQGKITKGESRRLLNK